MMIVTREFDVCQPMPTNDPSGFATSPAGNVRRRPRAQYTISCCALGGPGHSHGAPEAGSDEVVVEVSIKDDKTSSENVHKAAEQCVDAETARAAATRSLRSDSWRLQCAACLAFFFMFVEVYGGWLAESLAIMSDAAHLGLDASSYLLAFMAVRYSLSPGTPRYTYGYSRADVIGGFLSIISLWVLNLGLALEAFKRIISIMNGESTAETHGALVMVIASVGVAVNVVLIFVLGGEGGVGHLHSHGGGHGHSHGGSAAGGTSLVAAYMHALVDLMQSIGVLITGAIIWIKPNWQILDPVVTIVVVVVAFKSTKDVVAQSFGILMESTPEDVDIVTLRRSLESLHDGMIVRYLHCFSLSRDDRALTGQLVVHQPLSNKAHRSFLRRAEALCALHNIGHVTLQVEGSICDGGREACSPNEPCAEHKLLHVMMAKCYDPCVDDTNGSSSGDIEMQRILGVSGGVPRRKKKKRRSAAGLAAAASYRISLAWSSRMKKKRKMGYAKV